MIGRRRTKVVVGTAILLGVALLLAALPACAPKPAPPPPAPSPAPTPTPTPTPPPAPPPKPIKLVFSTYTPPKEAIAVSFTQYAKELEEKSGGRVTFEINTGGVLGKPAEHYNLLVSGLADIAMFNPTYTPGRFPLTDVTQLPVTKEASGEMHSKGYYELYKRGYFDEEYKDIKPVYMCVISTYQYHMAKGPVLTFANMKGKKIRVSGAVHNEIIKAFGSVPVSMAAPEIYTAMEKGIIDGNFVHWGFMESFGTIPVTKSVTEIGIAGFPFVIGISKASYEKLPADIQAMIDDMAPKYTAILGRMYDESAERSKKQFQETGRPIHQLSEADLQKVSDAVAPLWEKWIADMEAKGLPGRKIVDDYYNILKGMGVEKPFHGYAP
jgi:TRAP-type C4-dicarboxylate transport system substrate-binding protein